MSLQPHEHVLDYLDAYLTGALGKREETLVREHCGRCRICQVAAEEAEKRLAAIRAVPPVEASPQLMARTERRIDRYRSQTPFARMTQRLIGPPVTLIRQFPAATAVATVFLMIGALHIYYASLAPTPYDLRVLGQSSLLSGTQASLRCIVFDRRYDSGVVDIPVDVELVGRDQSSPALKLASFRTDSQGTGHPLFRVPEWSDGNYILRVTAHPQGGDETVSHPIKLTRVWQIMVSTDKPVYQPGQVIHLRSLVLRKLDLKPVADQPADVAVSDPKGNVIFRRQLMTSRFGIVAADCPLADEILQGAYVVECKVGETISRTNVQVQRYTLPKFKVLVKLDRPYYEPGDVIHGTVDANYFFGKPVANAQVTIDADLKRGQREEKLPRLSISTDNGGSVPFEIPVPGLIKEGGTIKAGGTIEEERRAGEDAGLTLTITVTDVAGERQSVDIPRMVTQQPIRIEVVPEGGRLVKHVSNRVYVMSTYVDGRPARTRVSVTGVINEIDTDDLGVAVVEVTPQQDTSVPPEGIAWNVMAVDAQKRTARRTVTLTCGASAQDFLVRSEKAVYQGGETVRLSAVGGGSKPVFIDLMREGQTILTDSIPMSDGRGEYEFDLPPELSGTVELCAYRFEGQGRTVMISRAIYIQPAKQLAVRTDLDRSEYPPGGQARISLTLVNSDGRGVPGALSLSAVDESVHSVLGQSSPSLYFAKDERLLKSVLEFYPWSPDVVLSPAKDEQMRFEQALFARTAQEHVSGRDALLQELAPYFGSGTRVLDVVNRPDWEQLSPAADIPDEIRSKLKNDLAHHTLGVASYEEKAHKIEPIRKSGLRFVKDLWKMAFLLMGIIVGVYVLVLIFSHPTLLKLFVMASMGLILIALMLPAVQRAREASRGNWQSSTLRQFAQAVENFRHENGRPPGANNPAIVAAPAARVREWFPETLLWRPELITDDNGRATLDLELADSITTWRLTASAVTADGRLGASESPIRVFQPFFVDVNLPVAMTRGDEIALPLVVYNYLDKPQTVELTVKSAPWFEPLEEAHLKVELPANGVAPTAFRIRVKKVGRQELEVAARGQGVADAIRRSVDVVPDGDRVELIVNGTLQQPAMLHFSVPSDAIEGSAKTILKIYPSSFSQVVEGLDAIFAQPYGCFEQTSSTTYPNILALDYLRTTGQSAPAVEAKAREYIHLGYQRLLGFEVPGGGFDWFGHPPANEVLTAYGLMEFQDMARVHEIDQNLIERTRRWLLDQRQPDGSWKPATGMLHEDPTQQGDLARVSATAYIAWAVYGRSGAQPDATPTRDFLFSQNLRDLDDSYTLALVCNALWALAPDDPRTTQCLDRLLSRKSTSPDGKLAWWEPRDVGRTVFHGGGRSRNIETTALATLALVASGREPATIRGALTWLAGQKDRFGNWHSTQATVLALKALIQGTGKPLAGENRSRRIAVSLDGVPLPDITISADEWDVVQQLDLSAKVSVGEHVVTLSDKSNGASGFQFLSWHHKGYVKHDGGSQPLSVELAYDRTQLAADETVTATATVTNQMPQTSPMVVLELPIPAGFTIDSADLAAAIAAKKIAKFQIRPRDAVLYLRALEPGQPLPLVYHLRATTAGKIAVAPAVAYEYYDNDKRAASEPVVLDVQAREAKAGF